MERPGSGLPNALHALRCCSLASGGRDGRGRVQDDGAHMSHIARPATDRQHPALRELNGGCRLLRLARPHPARGTLTELLELVADAAQALVPLRLDRLILDSRVELDH